MTKWVLPIVLSLALVFTGLWGYNQYRQNQQYNIRMDNMYQKSFYELVGNVGNVENRLTKLMVSGDRAQHTKLLSEISRQADAAQADLGQLPVSHIALTRTSKYLNQLSDYSYFLTKKVADGKTITAKESETLAKLRDSAIRLNADLRKLESQLQTDKLSWSELARRNKAGFYEASEDIVTKQFVSSDKTSIDYPSLIYDGPFSETLNQKVQLKGPRVSHEEARKTAVEFVGGKSAKQVKPAGDGSGLFDTWAFNIITDDEDNPVYVQVTKIGGKVVNMVSRQKGGQPRLSIEQAKQKAAEYLESKGYKNMVPTYEQHYDSVSTMNFAYKENDIIMYPDLIKVKISLETGDVYGFESRNYLIAHKERNLGKPKLTMDEARQLVNPNLRIKSSQMAVIPTEGKKESFCYEFRGEYQGNDFIVYIDANSGAEVEILQIIDNKNGTLAM